MAIQSINPFAPADLETEMFLGWENTISDSELAMKTATLRLYNIWASVNSMEVEIEQMDDLPTGWKIGDWVWAWWDDSATEDLDISADLAWKITNYTVIKVEDELVVVKSVNRTANTIDVFQRGHGSTTAAAHADEVDALITWYNYVVWVKDIESRVIWEETQTYYVAKNTVPAVSFTKEDLNIKRKYYWETGQFDYVNSQIDMMDKDLLITLNKSLIYHGWQKPANGNPWMTVWLIAEAMTNGNIVTTFGAISSVQKLNDALTASRNKWGSANVIVCGPSSYDDIQKLANDSGITQSVPDRLQMVLGASVKAIVTKIWTLIPVLDLSFPDDKIVICNSKDLFWAPLSGFEAPWADRTIAQESTRNNQAFSVDSLTEWVSYYYNSNKNMTILTWVTH